MHGRKNSLRKTKRPRYSKPPDEMEAEEDEGRQEGEQQQPGSSSPKASVWTTQEKGLLPVTCGNKKGLLDTDKLGSGEECIECDGRWFAPPAFEEFGGKGACKKWKSTILHENKSLQTLFSKGLLITKGYKKSSNATLKPERLSSLRCSSSCSSEGWLNRSPEQRCSVNERGEEREEDVQGNEEPQLATRMRGEEGAEAENGGEEHVVNSEHEEDETEDKGTKDHEAAAAAAEDDDKKNDGNVCKDKENKILPTNKFQMKLTLRRTELLVRNCSDVPPIVEDVGSNDEELMQSHEGKDGEREMSPGSASTAAPPSPQMNGSEHTGSLSIHRDLSSSPPLLITEVRSGSLEDMMDDREEEEDEELDEPVLHKYAMTSGHSAALIQVLKLERSPPHTPLASDSGQSSGPFARPHWLRWELDELRREKIRRQLRVLRLQEEYYSLKIKRMKNCSGSL